MNAPGTGAPKVYVDARYRPQPHSSIEQVKFGLPNARRSRVIQSTESLSAEVDGEADPNTTASGPLSSAISPSLEAIVSSASSQLICSHPGSGAPLGRVRRSGWSSRSGCSRTRGAALPFTQTARPVGWAGSGPIAVSRPSTTVAVAPQRDTHIGQKVAT